MNVPIAQPDDDGVSLVRCGGTPIGTVYPDTARRQPRWRFYLLDPGYSVGGFRSRLHAAQALAEHYEHHLAAWGARRAIQVAELRRQQLAAA